MSTENAVEAVTAPTKKVKKSNVVDAGLRAGLSTDEIVKNVLASFPETLEKGARNLISVRRSKLKQPKATV